MSKKEDTKALLRGHVVTINRCNIFNKRRMIVDKVNKVVKLVLECPLDEVNVMNLCSEKMLVAQLLDVKLNGNS
jgi:hypothetical protein